MPEGHWGTCSPMVITSKGQWFTDIDHTHPFKRKIHALQPAHLTQGLMVLTKDHQPITSFTSHSWDDLMEQAAHHALIDLITDSWTDQKTGRKMLHAFDHGDHQSTFRLWVHQKQHRYARTCRLNTAMNNPELRSEASRCLTASATHG